MDEVETHEGGPAESYHTGINRKSAIMADRGEINGFDTVLFRSPAPFATLEVHAESVMRSKPKVRGEDGYLVASLDEPASQGTHLDHRSALFLKRIVGLHNFQDAHGEATFTPRNQTS